jgi:hypothetical protein
MRQLIALIGVITIIAGTAMAQSSSGTQNYAFRVLASKGNTTVTRDSNSWKALKAGGQLTKDDKIRLADDSFLGLVHANGRTLELKTPGTYAVSELIARMGTGSSSINQRYVDFVINEMTKDDREDVTKNRHRNMGIEGKVERGDGLQLLIPEETIVISANSMVKWYPAGQTGTYMLTVKDMFGEILYAATTPDTALLIDFSTSKFTSDDNLFTVEVALKESAAMASRPYGVRKLSGAEATTLQKNIQSIIAGEEESSLVKLFQAMYYEENKLYLDAVNSYEQAIRMQPGVDDYKRAYRQFLLRHNLIRQ